jgi:hypothetical protein
MSNATTSRQPRKSRAPTTFRCELVYGADRYTIAPIAGVHPDVASRAFRMRKNGCPDVYDVRLTVAGYAECDCKGHQRWGHCKHVCMLIAVGCLPMTAAAKRPTPEVQPARPPYRSPAHLAADDPEACARLQQLWGDPREGPLGEDGDYVGYPESAPPTHAELDQMAESYGQ